MKKSFKSILFIFVAILLVVALTACMFPNTPNNQQGNQNSGGNGNENGNENGNGGENGGNENGGNQNGSDAERAALIAKVINTI